MPSPLHTLYRFYASNGALLYVGITNNPGRRFSKHRDDKDWWLDVARIDMEQYPSREALNAAEQRAIQNERPLHNIKHNLQAMAAAVPCRGLLIGEVYALALKDGTCPVGLVVAGVREGVTLDLYSWITSRFTAGEEWVSADSISRHKRADKTIDGQHTIFEMDALGDYQTDWVNLIDRVCKHQDRQ